MFAYPLTPGELGLVAVVVGAALAVAGLAAWSLARRKGYDGGLWVLAGVTLVGLVLLAFLPDVQDVRPEEKRERQRRTGNKFGGLLAAAAFFIGLAASFVTNPDEDALKRFVREELPLSRDRAIQQMIGGASGWQVSYHNHGLFSTGTVRFGGQQGTVTAIGFSGAWRAVAAGKSPAVGPSTTHRGRRPPGTYCSVPLGINTTVARLRGPPRPGTGPAGAIAWCPR